MQFKPNFDLYKIFEETEKISDFHAPYFAIFKKENKTLIYLCDRHCANVSFDAIDFCFSDQRFKSPEVSVIEYPHDKKNTKWGFHDNSLIYAGAVSAKNNIPVVYADLSDDEMLKILKMCRPDKELDKEDLNRTRRSGGAFKNKGEYNLLSLELNKYGRDPFMLENIATALNKYDTVFAMFGEGHYRCHRAILEDMLGTAEYFDDIPNTRGDFNNFEIKPLELINSQEFIKNITKK